MSENTATDRLLKAFYRRDVGGVNQALLDGADVNRRESEKDPDPIWFSLIKLVDYRWPDFGRLSNGAEERATISQMWDMIIPRVAKAAAPYRYGSCIGLSQEIVALRNTEVASSIVMTAINETNGDITFNLPELFSTEGNPTDPYHPARQLVKDQIHRTHDRVLARLSNPNAPFEVKTTASLSGAGKAYWLESLSFDLADLPVPSQQFCDAVDQMVGARKEAEDLRAPYRGQEMPVGVRSAFDMALQESREARREVEQLRLEGRTGWVRVPRGSNLSGATKGGSTAPMQGISTLMPGSVVPPSDQPELPHSLRIPDASRPQTPGVQRSPNGSRKPPRGPKI
jgi:hypothetical protein